MSPDLNAVRQRAKAATAGPWSVGQRWEDEDQAMANWLPINRTAIDPENPHQPERVALIRYYPGGFQFPHAEARADAEFIAHAREDVPALLGKIGHTAPKCEAEAALAAVEQDRDRLRAELEQVRTGTWRDYTLEPCGDGVAALCRSDDICMDAALNREGHYLTLGEAVDWAQSHVRWHAEMNAEDEAGQ